MSPVYMREAETRGDGDSERQIEMLCWAFCSIIVCQCIVKMHESISRTYTHTV